MKWSLTATEEGRELRRTVWVWDWMGTISQLYAVLWDTERRSAATPLMLSGRSNVVVEERGCRELCKMKLLSLAPGLDLLSLSSIKRLIPTKGCTKHL